eukprot:9362492-Pyramimonas_sp.AAC.1
MPIVVSSGAYQPICLLGAWKRLAGMFVLSADLLLWMQSIPSKRRKKLGPSSLTFARKLSAQGCA